MKWVKRCAKKITTYIKLRSSFQKLISFCFSNLEGAGDGDGSPDPDVLLIGAFGDILLYHSGEKIETDVEKNMIVPFEENYWVKPSGAYIERKDLMVVLTNLEGLYIRASYGVDNYGQARISKVSLDSAHELRGDRNMTEQDIADQVTR